MDTWRLDKFGAWCLCVVHSEKNEGIGGYCSLHVHGWARVLLCYPARRVQFGPVLHHTAQQRRVLTETVPLGERTLWAMGRGAFCLLFFPFFLFGWMHHQMPSSLWMVVVRENLSVCMDVV